MPDYRLYVMDRFSGHIDHAREFEAADDLSAISRSVDWHDGRPMELWRGAANIKRWKATAIGPPDSPIE